MSGRSVLITGASTGFGYDLALRLAEMGDTPVASMREADGRNAPKAAEFRDRGVAVVEIDVTDDASVERGVKEALNLCGHLDVLVNNAGFGMFGALEAVTPQQMRDVFETNVFGVHRMVRAVLPSMRERGEGLLVHISSGAGRLTFPGSGAYCASKWALEAMGEALRYELAPLGIDSCIVEPGRYETDFHDRSLKRGEDASRADAYSYLAEAMRKRSEALGMGDAREVIDVIVELIGTPRGSRPTRTFIQPRGRDLLDPLNNEQSRLAHLVVSMFGDEAMLANGV